MTIFKSAYAFIQERKEQGNANTVFLISKTQV
eukprot:CAMPEP_0170499780 /NCGR_PEP_ID=MMETSP0208-20121228/32551_1 /TAXON_ID=197538 /ORGANISM="Strombidium inclinatum, Strain S3" /LENGTH=31 /DNA_ID= /DNA_START= /DNA_END= /DNA_ORIENTATION=